MLPTYAHKSALSRFRAYLEDRIRIKTGPIYMGEAEYMMLYPLLRALREATSDPNKAAVASHAYQASANYALIFDISKISQSKDIAKEVTQTSLEEQPIVKLFKKRAEHFKKSNPESRDKAKNAIWWDITTMLQYGIQYSVRTVGSEVQTPLELLSTVISPIAIKDTVGKSTPSTFTDLLSYLRHGKGTPLDRAGRKEYMMIITEVLMRIDYLIDIASLTKSVAGSNAAGEEVSITVAANTGFSDAFTAMYWFKLYLDAVDQYDVIFPSSDIMLQSQAWVLSIKTQAAKLKKLFIDIAHVAISFDIKSAMVSWEEVHRFLDPVLNHSVSAVSDMTSVWSENVSRADKLLSPFATQAAESIVAELKGYVKADYLLPEQDFQLAGTLLMDWKKPQPTDGIYLSEKGLNVVTSLDTVGELPMSVGDRDMIIPYLATSASVIEEALAFIKRSREILQLTEETDDIYHALIPDGSSWTPPYKLDGTINDMRLADFKRHDPMQLCYEKYTVAQQADSKGAYIASLEWRFAKLLMTPFYRIPQLQQFTTARTKASRVIWPGIGQLPVSDVITAGYVAQPLPAAYTASRNMKFVPNDMTSYIMLMSGHSGVTVASRDMFRKIAALFEKFPSTYAVSVVDALAATMFVYKLVKGKKEWELLKPTCPTIYGAPRDAMIKWNKETFTGEPSDELRRRSTSITLPSGVSYTFVLHKLIPSPGKLVYFSYPYAKGVYLHIPLLESVFTQNQNKLLNVLGITIGEGKTTDESYDIPGDAMDSYVSTIQELSDLGGVKSTPVLGWAPFLMNLPHILFDYQPEVDVLDADYDKYAMLSLQVRYDDIERLIYIGGFIDNPVELLDITDYEKAREQEDPSPISDGSAVSTEPVDPDPAAEKKRSEVEDMASPEKMAPVARSDDGRELDGARREAVRTITDAPLYEGGKLHAPTDPKPAAAEFKVDNSQEVLKGDPAEKHESGDDADKKGNKYWKKIAEDGTVLEVIAADACPAGYVPASEEEYRKHVVKNASKEVSDKEA